MFADNTTAIAYFKKAGGMKSLSLNNVAQSILRMCESMGTALMPQFVSASLSVLADALSRSNQVLGGSGPFALKS